MTVVREVNYYATGATGCVGINGHIREQKKNVPGGYKYTLLLYSTAVAQTLLLSPSLDRTRQYIRYVSMDASIQLGL